MMTKFSYVTKSTRLESLFIQTAATPEKAGSRHQARVEGHLGATLQRHIKSFESEQKGSLSLEHTVVVCFLAAFFELHGNVVPYHLEYHRNFALTAKDKVD